ncbi:MAG: hypothetical protein HY735_33075 [Verrucomicrobia bacterium]|nr:hypothetical protein [Verrucomicrobiota bacterium]
MITRCPDSNPARAGYALVMVLFFAGLSMLALGTALNWTSTSAIQTERQNRYFSLVAAAEAATEKVLARVTLDYKNGGESTVFASLSTYRALVPTSAESSFWNGFEFNNADGVPGQTFVNRITSEAYVDLNSQYQGLRGWASTYRVLSNVRELNSPYAIVGAVNQDVQVASIPIFQFAIFYGLDLEVNTMTTMTVNGRVHCNGTIYTYPSAPLTFKSDVTSVAKNIKTRKPGDPAYSSAPPSGSITYQGQKDTGVASMNLPIGTNNSPDAVREVLQIPHVSESIGSPMGQQRYYNKAELLILVTNSAVTVAAKTPFSASPTSIPWLQATNFVSTNLTFTDQREGKTVRVTQIDVSKLQSWSSTNSGVQTALGASIPVNLIYVADNRTTTSSQLNAVRLVNGQTLPSRGLTVATPNPVYVKGHYNQPTTAHLGTTNTSNAKPASLVSDALTILSGNWTDSASSGSYSSRNASSTTVNAAILTGIVETTNSPAIYSGGVHNLGRFLENWSGDTFTCNGSMVVLFPSIKATAPFQQPGAYYYPPARNYSFDLNYLDITKQPPGTPEVRAIIRSTWNLPPPNTTDFAAY